MPLATSSFLRTIIKAVESHLGQRLPRFRRGTVVGQSGNPLKVLVSPSGEQGVADGFEYPVLRSYTSVTVDDPGGPHEGDDLLILETTPNNPVLLGQLLTGPNDKANRDSYPGIDKVSITQNDAKKLRAHAIVVDHVPPIDADVPATARDGMSIVSNYDNSLWKRVSGTWYQVGATKWGAVVDTDGFIDVWIAASVTLPTDGTGDQTAHTTPGYTPDVYNTSALGLDGGDSGHALYVKIDGTSITQDNQGRLKATAGGTGAGVAFLATDYSHSIVSGDITGGGAPKAFGLMTWLTPDGSNHDFDTGGYFNPANPSRLTIPSDGIYEISGQIEFVADPGKASFMPVVQLNKNGIAIAGFDLIVNAKGNFADGGANVYAVTVPIQISQQCLAGDYWEMEWFIFGPVVGQNVGAEGDGDWFTIKQIG